MTDGNAERTILLITTSYPIGQDGSEAAGTFVADLAEELALHVPVRVVAPGQARSASDDDGRLRVWRYAAGERPLSLLSPANPLHWPVIFRILRSMRTQALAATADGNVAHILALWVLPSGWIAREMHRRRGISYSTWALGSDLWSLGRMPLLRTLLRHVMRGATHRYADGLQLADDAAAIAGQPVEFLPSTRRILHARAEPPRAEPPYRLLYIGRWHPNKGIDLLLESLALLREEDWRRIEILDIYGGGPMEPLVRERVAELRAEGRPVVLHGYVGKSGAERAMADADWLLLPSRIESIPLVFSDAMKLGLPLVAMPVGDLPRLFANPHPFGVLAASAQAGAFLSAIMCALEMGAYPFAHGLRTQANAFSLRDIAKRVVDDALPPDAKGV